jgi:hypothetical protein
MRDERSDTDHVALALGEEEDVAGEYFGGLSGRADHDAASDLVAEAAEIFQAFKPGRNFASDVH